METMDWVSTQDAKRCYYLTTDDLRQVESVSVGGGIGCGRPTNLYEPDGLLRQSIRVHGEAGYQKKLAARLKREAKKRQREDDADAALEAMRAPKKKQQVVDLTDENDGAAAAAAAPLPAVNTVKLRRSLLKMSKKAFGFTMGGAPAQWRVQVPSITPEVFAALCGRPADRALATFVKRGAYHTHCGTFRRRRRRRRPCTPV